MRQSLRSARWCSRTFSTNAHAATVNPRPPPRNVQELCRQSVQDRDKDHFACLSFLPAKAREAAFTVRAFNIELAMLRDVAKQGPARSGRIQFWRQLLDDAYKGNPADLPLAQALSLAVKEHKLTKGWFLRILDAREKDLKDRIPLKIEDVENYAESTASSLLYLTLESCGVKNVHADHAASHVGKAYGIVTLLRALPFTASQRQTYLPLSLLNKHSVAMEDVFRGKNSKELQEVVWELASNASVHIEHARELRMMVPVVARSALLPAVVASSWLGRLQRSDFNAFDPALHAPDPWLFARLYWAHIRGMY